MLAAGLSTATCPCLLARQEVGVCDWDAFAASSYESISICRWLPSASSLRRPRLAQLPPGSEGHAIFPSVGSALIAICVLLLSVLTHELVRMVIADRVGGRTNLIVLGPIGGWAQPHLPADPPAHLVTALSGPLTYLALLVSAGCALAAAGEDQILQLVQPVRAAVYSPPTVSSLHLAAQYAVWINACLLLANLLPISPVRRSRGAPRLALADRRPCLGRGGCCSHCLRRRRRDCRTGGGRPATGVQRVSARMVSLGDVVGPAALRR